MEVAGDVVLPLGADGGLGRVRDAEHDPWVRFGADGVDREQELVERFRWPSVAEIEQPQRSRDARSHERRAARGLGFQFADPRAYLPLVAAHRVDRGEIGQVPGRDPLLPEVEREASALFGRGVREVELPSSEELRRLRLEGVRQRRHERAFACEANRSAGVGQTVTPVPCAAGTGRHPDQAVGVVETGRDLDRASQQLRSPVRSRHPSSAAAPVRTATMKRSASVTGGNSAARRHRSCIVS